MKRTTLTSSYDVTHLVIFVVLVVTIASIIMNVYILKQLKSMELDIWSVKGMMRIQEMQNKLDHKHCYSQERTNETTEQADILRP